MRLALIVEYDGTDFSGSQFQLNARTVQGVLEDAATTIFGAQTGRIRMASRTDAGVHAAGQVAALDTVTEMSNGEIRNAMNGNLPEDVCVKLVQSVPADFDPRRAAIAREYRYVINDGHAPSPIRRRFEYYVHRPLDDKAMANCAQIFVGVHDFTSFAAASIEDSSNVREVAISKVIRTDDGRIAFDIRANAFVRQQIRRMVASLVAVGHGSRTKEWVASLMATPRRDGATQNAPPHGLTLQRVVYECKLDHGPPFDE